MKIDIKRLRTPFIFFVITYWFIGQLGTSVLIAVFVGYVNWVYRPSKKENSKGSKKLFGEDEKFITIILLLSASVIKADGRIYKKELDLVRKRLEHNFGPKNIDEYMAILDHILKNKTKIDSVCFKVKNNLDYPSKIQLLHFLTGLSVSNGILIDAEYDILAKIARLIEVTKRSFISILAMFTYSRQHSYDKTKSHSKSKGYKSYSKPTSTSKLTKAYQILELSSTASADEIKKGYRRLAKIHHPDRVAHLGAEYQKNAKVKFQKIVNAYDLIKDEKDFK